jgi:(2R)-3-sulfolactate dehydrogenase (NADP+)
MLALIVEVLVVALTGANFGFEASSFFVDEGNAPRIGQAFLLVDPGALAGGDVYFDRLDALVAEMLVDEGVRLAGERRRAVEAKSLSDGLELPDALVAQLKVLAQA